MPDSKQYIEEQLKALKFAIQQGKVDVSSNNRNLTKFTTSYTKEDVKKYLESPKRYEKELRNVTKALCLISSQFSRLVSYMPDMAMFNYILIPNVEKLDSSNKKKYISDYKKWSAYVDKLNIKHEFIKVLKTNYKYDAFFGYIDEKDESFYIKPLDNSYCKITSVTDGCLSFSFDLSFFDSEGKDYLQYYPNEFKKKYEIYKKDKKQKWQELNPDKTICTKFHEDMLDIVYPPYCSTFDDLYDINDYKQIDKQGAENENYQMIGMTMEVDSKNGEVNNWTVDPSFVLEYYDLIQQTLPEGIGLFLSPVKWDTAKFNNNKQSSVDRVQNANRNFWDNAGMSDVLFSSKANNAGTLKYSLLVDTNMLFGLYRQLERWLNKKLKKAFKGKVFVKILDMTRFNEKEFIDNQLKLAQYGTPNKLMLSSAIGLSPSEMMAMNILECDILELPNTMIPLSSSHTQNGGSDAGRPTSDDTDIQESGQQTRDNSSNENRD